MGTKLSLVKGSLCYKLQPHLTSLINHRQENKKLSKKINMKFKPSQQKMVHKRYKITVSRSRQKNSKTVFKKLLPKNLIKERAIVL
jgi:hypothetical protein